MTTILLILILVLLAIILPFLVAIRSNQKKVAEALGRAYGNINDLRNQMDDGFAGLDPMLVQIRQDQDKIRNEATEVAGATHNDLLEIAAVITRSFMEETIEIKQGIEVLVQAFSEAPPTGAVPTTSGPCQVKGCGKPGDITTTWKSDILSPAEDVTVCESHAALMAKQAFQAPKPTPAAAPATPTAPDREKFAKEHGIGEGEPDTSVLVPEPFDPITAAIEASFRAGKQG